MNHRRFLSGARVYPIVHIFERVTRPHHPLDHPFFGQKIGRLIQHLLQIIPLNEIHHKEVLARGGAEVIGDAHQTRVVEPRQQFRLLFEQVLRLRVGLEHLLHRQRLARQVRIADPVDRAEAALAQ